MEPENLSHNPISDEEKVCLINLLKNIESNRTWICDNIEDLLGEYDGNFIAVIHQEVVGSNEDYCKLLQDLKDKYGKRPKETYIDFITSKPQKYLL